MNGGQIASLVFMISGVEEKYQELSYNEYRNTDI